MDALRAVETVTDHWDRPAGETYHWLIEVGNEPDVAELVGRLQKPLSALDFDWTPPPWAHLTVHRLGCVEETAEETVDEAVETARGLLMGFPAFTVELGPLAGSPGALRLVAAPSQDLCAVYSRLRIATMSAVPTATPPPATAFRPHVDIGHCPRSQAVTEALDRLDPFSPLAVRIVEVVLARVRGHRWEAVARIGLRER